MADAGGGRAGSGRKRLGDAGELDLAAACEGERVFTSVKTRRG